MNLTKPLVTFDVETTGVDISTDKIIQFSAVKQTPDGEITELDLIINPNRAITNSSIHGITDAMVKDKPIFYHFAKEIFDFISGCDLCGYNLLRFDIPLLIEELARCGIKYSVIDISIIDVFFIYKKLHPQSLGHAYKKYVGVELENAHNSLIDTRATLQLLRCMMEKEDIGKDVKELESFSESKKGLVDFAGKFIRDEDGVVRFNFGTSRGYPVKDNLSMLIWMQSKDFPQDTKEWASKLREEAIKEIENNNKTPDLFS